MNTNEKMPAFPASSDSTWGLTKYEYIAVMAMQGLLANPNGFMTADNRRSFNPDDMAKTALAHTNAIINALNKDQ